MQMITALEMCIIVSYIFQSWFAHLLLPDMRPGICFSVGLRGFKKHINDLPALKVHNISEFSPALSRCTTVLKVRGSMFFCNSDIFIIQK